jgi:hypothetical protein
MEPHDHEERPSTPAFLKQREAPDPSLREYYDQLVQDYRYYAFVDRGAAYVSYKVSADLAKAGWRRTVTDATG